MSGGVTVERIQPVNLIARWAGVRDHILSAMAEGAGFLWTEWDVKKRCLAGDAWALWIISFDGVDQAALVTRIEDYPLARICIVFLAGGSGMRECYEQISGAIEAYARQVGCAYLWAQGREGWLRQWGAKEIGRVMMKEIA